MDNLKQKMQAVIKVFQDDVASLRVGKATPSLIEDVVVPAYGGTQELKVMELASINASDTQTLVVNPWDKSVIGEAAKAINNAGLGVTAVIDGEIIRVIVPPVTEERRQELIKVLHAKLENAKIQLRQVRHDELNGIRTEFETKVINEDEKFAAEKELQTVMDDFTEKVDQLGKEKESELLKV